MIEQYKLDSDSPRKDSEEDSPPTAAEPKPVAEASKSLRESVRESVRRDALVVYAKLWAVANPFGSPQSLADSTVKWELFGPFLFIVFSSLSANKARGVAPRLRLRKRLFANPVL